MKQACWSFSACSRTRSRTRGAECPAVRQPLPLVEERLRASTRNLGADRDGAHGSVPTHGLLVEVDVDLFGLEVALDTVAAELAALTAHLDAAPRGLDVGRLHVVDPHDAD